VRTTTTLTTTTTNTCASSSSIHTINPPSTHQQPNIIMFCKNLFTAFAAFSAVVSAQNYSVGTDGELMIDPTQISSGERQSWCLGQRNNCPLICGGSANPNSCDAVRSCPTATTTSKQTLIKRTGHPRLDLHLH
jgi:hypothetical protein